MTGAVEALEYLSGTEGYCSTGTWHLSYLTGAEGASYYWNGTVGTSYYWTGNEGAVGASYYLSGTVGAL